MYRIGIYLLAGLAVLFGLVVGTLNSERVSLDLLWLELEWPLGLIMVASLVVGLLLGITALWIGRVLPLQLKLRNLRKKLPPEEASAVPAESRVPELPKG